MSSDEQKLTRLFNSLPTAQQKTLLEFAEFLVSRAPPVKPVVTEKVEIERPEEENVINAIKRLKATYPMVNHQSMFSATSDLMMQHMMQGRSAVDIIDELEAMFDQHYQEFLRDLETP